MTDEYLEQRIVVTEDQDGARLDVLVARAYGWTRARAQHVIAEGATYVDRRRERTPGLHVRAGQELRILPAAPDRTGIGGGGVTIVLETDRLVVVNKPAGLPTQPPPRGGDALNLRVHQWLTERAQPGQQVHCGEVHRLDRDVSGLVVFGLDPEATAGLSGQFRDHQARRRYLALVRTALPVLPQTIAEPIAEVPPARMVVSATGMPAVTHVLPLAFDAAARLALVLVELQTGRMHQVRVHLAWGVGAIAGDVQYGDLPGPTPPQRIALHAAVLNLREPTRTHRVVLPPPADFWAAAGVEPWPLPPGWADLPVAPIA